MLKAALDNNLEKASIRNNLGLTYFEKDDMTSAIDQFKAACQLEGTAVHFNNYGLALFHNRDIREAIENFDKALQLNQTVGDPTIYFNKGNALLHLSQMENLTE